MTLDGHLDVTATDDAVAFAFAVTNTGTDPAALTFPSGEVVDVAVHHEDTEIWRWSEGRMFTQALQTERVDPGDSLRRTVRWDDPRSGTYVATATLEATDADLTTQTRFEV
jgi:hypothetical protein